METVYLKGKYHQLTMDHIFVLLIFRWGDFDIRKSRLVSAHSTEVFALTAGFNLGLPNEPPEDDGDWFEVEKVRFGV
jgi:hypothetical protein